MTKGVDRSITSPHAISPSGETQPSDVESKTAKTSSTRTVKKSENSGAPTFPAAETSSSRFLPSRSVAASTGRAIPGLKDQETINNNLLNLEARLNDVFGRLGAGKKNSKKIQKKLYEQFDGLMKDYCVTLEQIDDPGKACQNLLKLWEKVSSQLEAMPFTQGKTGKNRQLLQDMNSHLGQQAVGLVTGNFEHSITDLLQNSTASEKVRMLVTLKELDVSFFPDTQTRLIFQNMCESMAFRELMNPQQNFGGLMIPRENLAAVRNMTEGYHKENMAETLKSSDKSVRLQAPEQTRKDYLRLRLKLLRNGKQIFDNNMLKKKLRSGYSAEGHENIDKVHGQVSELLDSLPKQQQMLVLSHLNQTEFNDMCMSFHFAQERMMGEWGTFDINDSNKVIEVNRLGDEVHITYTIKATPRLSTRLDGGATIQYDNKSFVDMQKTVIIRPDQDPDYSLPQIYMYLNEGQVV